MPLQWVESWDLYNNTGVIDNNTSNWFGGSQRTADTSVFRTGNQSCKILGTGVAITRTVSAATSVFYLGFGFRENNEQTDANNTAQGVRITGSNGTLVFRRRNTLGQYSLYVGTSVVEDASQSYAGQTFHYGLIKCAVNTGAYTVWINRDQVMNGTSSNIGTISQVSFLCLGTSPTTGDPNHFDDIFFWSDPDSAAVSAIEAARDFRVRLALPVSTVSNTSWNVSGVSTVDQALDNVPFVSTQFIEATSGVSANTVVEFEDITSGVSRVFGLQLDIRSRKTDAGPGTLRSAVIVSGVSADSSDFFQAINDTYYTQTFTSAPNGNTWDVSDLGKLNGSITRVE